VSNASLSAAVIRRSRTSIVLKTAMVFSPSYTSLNLNYQAEFKHGRREAQQRVNL